MNPRSGAAAVLVLLGRATGSSGERSAARYLAQTCARSTIRVTGPGVDTSFVQWEDFIPDVGTARTLHGVAGPLVYVGRAPDILFRRSDLPSLTGAVALLRGEFGGAVGVIEVIDDARRYRLFRQTRGVRRLYVRNAAIPSSFIPPLPSMLAGLRMTVTLYQGLTGVSHGSWNDAYLNGLAAGLPAPQPIDGWRAEVRIETVAAPTPGMNVVCLLPGRGPGADTAIALAAHYDHLGVGPPDARGDSIYNGYSDNAVGVGMAVAVAERLARDARAGAGLAHSLLLLFFTGEEAGLLSSDYFVAQPTWPLNRLRGVINLDANLPAGPPRAWRVAGDPEGSLARLVVAEAGRAGWDAPVAPPAPGSDYFPFVRRGVPAVFTVPSDEWTADLPSLGIARYATFTRNVLRRLDTGEGGGRVPALARRQWSRIGPGASW